MNNKHRMQCLAQPQAVFVAGSVVMLLSLSGVALAQGAAEPAGAQPKVWIEPRVSVGLTLSNNAGAAGSALRSEQVFEISPGVRVVNNSPRVKGFLDYSLSGLYYAQDTSGNRLRHALNASANVNAWDNRAFVDLSAVASEEAISAFGPQSSAVSSDTNRSQTTSFRFSPYLRGALGSAANYTLRYGLQTSSTDTASRSDITTHDLSLALGGRGAGQVFGWSINAAHQDTDYSLGQRIKSDTVRGGLVYHATPQLNFTLFAGVESNDALTPERKSYDNSGVSLDWRPSTRTRVSMGADQRYFGTGHNLSVEHRTGRTVWRVSDVRSASNDLGGSASASLGSVFDLLDSLYASFETDPIKRAQLVDAELLKLGLSPDTEIFQNFLTSSATLGRTQQMSVALLGVRSVVTLSLSQSDTRRLNTASSLGGLVDDFSTNTSIKQRAMSVVYAHRLTPITSVNASLSTQKSVGSNGISEASSQSLALGLSTRLGLRTTGSVQLRRTVNDGDLSNGAETSIAGLITHRF